MRRHDGQGGGIDGAGNVVVTSVPAIAAHRRSTDGVGEVYASAQWDRPNLQRCPIQVGTSREQSRAATPGDWRVRRLHADRTVLQTHAT